MSWPAYLGAILLFSAVFAVFYAVAYSVLQGIYENYRRYYQKAELQWTGPDSRALKTKTVSIPRLLALSFLTAWLVVHLIIQP